MVGFSDSDYASYVDDKKSTSNYIFMIVEAVVSWKSVKQTLTDSSTMKAKYVACYEATCHAIWLWNFISTLEVVHSICRLLNCSVIILQLYISLRILGALLAPSTLM